MNILFFCSEYPPHTTGGIGRVTKIVAEVLVARGHNVNVIGFYPNLPEDVEISTQNGVNVFRYKLDSIIEKFPRCFRVIRELGLSYRIAQKQLDRVEDIIEQHIAKYSIDVFEMTDYYPFVLNSSKLSFRKFCCPTVLRVHGSASFVQELSGKGKKYYTQNDSEHFSRCDYVSAVSKYSLKYVEDNYTLPQGIRKSVIYNPIDDDYLHQSSDKDDDILFVGKVTETKGAYTLAKAFNKIAPKFPKARLIYAGNGKKDEILKIIYSGFHDRVIFLGYCDRNKLTEAIDQSSFACIPSYFENFSMVVLEVMSRQKTLIFTERTSWKIKKVDQSNMPWSTL